jgi:hypothetical protein
MCKRLLRVTHPDAGGELRASIRENRAEIVEFLEEYCGAAWPPVEGSAIHGHEEGALKMLEIQKGAA